MWCCCSRPAVVERSNRVELQPTMLCNLMSSAVCPRLAGAGEEQPGGAAAHHPAAVRQHLAGGTQPRGGHAGGAAGGPAADRACKAGDPGGQQAGQGRARAGGGGGWRTTRVAAGRSDPGGQQGRGAHLGPTHPHGCLARHMIACIAMPGPPRSFSLASPSRTPVVGTFGGAASRPSQKRRLPHRSLPAGQWCSAACRPALPLRRHFIK